MDNPETIDSVTQMEKPKVTVWGIYNAGKSSLLNMLTSHIDTEFFPTGDIRVTTSIKMFEDEHAVYLDTPGLDANDKDTQEAVRGIRQADIVIFAHQIGSGELDKLEISFLKNTVQSFGKYANSNIIIALTKIDGEAKNPEKINQIEKRVAEQCHEIGFSPKIFQISNTRYQKGIKENKQGLIKHSHITEMKQALMQALTESNSNSVQKERIQQEMNAYAKDLLNQLKAVKKQLKSTIANEKANLAKDARDFVKFTKEMNKLVDFINQKDKEICEI